MKNIFLTSFISSIGVISGMAGSANVPSDLETKEFANSKIVPCPAVLAASPYGDVYVGVDLQGSLGKKINLGSIVKLQDTDNDGKADKHSVYTKVDNPRGIISIGDRLYVLHCTQKDGKIYNQDLSVFVDADNDGVADGPAQTLIKGIGNQVQLQNRGTDHSTNNIRLGIDGWIYISVGDFGFVDAEGTDGTKLSMHGGGIVRVRPDGSEMETFIHGTRNVYDVAIDPFMNVFTRENTNDGVGWWVRFSHYIQSGEYGYPSLYTNFPEDMLPALGEYGSGSGTGNLYFEEPGWPEKYNKTNMMADWGRSHIYIHRVEKDGASFTDEPEDFIGSSQVSDLDVDGSGRMYISAWDGAGYKGNPNKGYVSIVTPKGWSYKEFPDLKKLSAKALVAMLKTPSSTARVYAQQEILRRNDAAYLPHLEEIAADSAVSAEGRVAAIYTLAQLGGADAQKSLAKLSSDTVLKEHCIRAMADRLKFAKSADVNLFKAALDDEEPRVQVAAAVALGRVGDVSVAPILLAKATSSAASGGAETVDNFVSSEEVSGSKSADIDVDINTYIDLYLIVDPSGENANDQVAWINPTIIMKDGKKVPLTKTKWVSASQGKGKTLVNKDSLGKALPNKAKGIGTHAKSVIHYKLPKHAVRFTAKGIVTNGKGSVKFVVSKSPKPGEPAKLHSTPNSSIILPHVAVQSLLRLKSEDACIEALNSSDEKMQRGALAAMKFMHSEKVVDALILAAQKDSGMKSLIVSTLIRLHQKEIEYDGVSWWSTRPKPDGPYYYPVDWAGSSKISAFLNSVNEGLDADAKKKLLAQLKRNKAYVLGLNPRPKKSGKVVATVGKSSIEDIVLYVSKHKGKAKNGAKVIGKVGCIACHGIKPGDVVKGPDLTKLGKMTNADLAESIIKPGATIAASWVSITMKDGANHMGTIVKKDAKEIILHNIAGIPTKLDATKVAKTEPGLNMMSLHLTDDLTLPQFADLLGYIKSIDKSAKKK